MNEAELLDHINALEKDSIGDDFLAANARFYDNYMGELYGDEEVGKSSYVSTDVADVIEADMPSLARVFLGSNEVMKFEPLSMDKEAEEEAAQKTKYINYLVRGQEDSYKTLFDWLKAAEIHKISIVKFFCREEESVEVKQYKGLSDEELTIIMDDLKEIKGVQDVDVMETADDGNHIRLKVKRKVKKYVVEGVPLENFRISKNAESLKKSTLVGDACLKKRGDLLIEGYDKETINDLPMAGETEQGSVMRAARWRDQGGDFSKKSEWATEEVEVKNFYPLIDYDDDGIAERRHVIKCGHKILKNEWIGVVPYAVLTTVLMPYKLAGRSRAEIVSPTQKLKTHIQRQINDNLYQVNRPRTIANENANIDDLMVHRTAGVVRTKGKNPVGQDVAPLVTPYIGDAALQVVQYIDAQRAQTTGSLMANQGLEADNIHKETATRFEGVEDASKAKVELIARGHAETGFRQLYEGMAYLVSHYQDDATEIRVLGETLSIDPTEWKYEHLCTSQVGLGAGDDEKTAENMSSLLQIHNLLAQQGSELTDSKKVYNVLSVALKNMGHARISDYFNDPEKPEEMLMAQNEKMKAILGEIGQQNPLAEAEQVKADAAKEIALLKASEDRKNTELKARLDMMKEELTAERKEREMMLKAQDDKFDHAIELFKLRAEYGAQAAPAPTDLVYDEATNSFNPVANAISPV